ncbi:unnamed protein product, partial [marine sediment metagenome]
VSGASMNLFFMTAPQGKLIGVSGEFIRSAC